MRIAMLSMSALVLWLAAIRPALVFDLVIAQPHTAYRFYVRSPGFYCLP